MKEIIGGRDITIVGNGKAAPIPKDTVVIRMNHGIADPCDIWIDNVTHVYAGRGLKAPEGTLTVQGRTLLTDREMKFLTTKLGERKPSTGIRVLWYFICHYPRNTKYITGFEGDVNIYRNNKRMFPVHDWVMERKVVSGWIDQGLLEKL